MIKPLDKGFVWFFRGDYIYLEEDPFHLTTVLIITTLLSFISLHTGKNKRKKMEKDIKEHNSFLNFLKNNGLR